MKPKPKKYDLGNLRSLIMNQIRLAGEVWSIPTDMRTKEGIYNRHILHMAALLRPHYDEKFNERLEELNKMSSGYSYTRKLFSELMMLCDRMDMGLREGGTTREK